MKVQANMFSIISICFLALLARSPLVAPSVLLAKLAIFALHFDPVTRRAGFVKYVCPGSCMSPFFTTEYHETTEIWRTTYKFYENSTKLLCKFKIKFRRVKFRT